MRVKGISLPSFALDSSHVAPGAKGRTSAAMCSSRSWLAGTRSTIFHPSTRTGAPLRSTAKGAFSSGTAIAFMTASMSPTGALIPSAFAPARIRSGSSFHSAPSRPRSTRTSASLKSRRERTASTASSEKRAANRACLNTGTSRNMKSCGVRIREISESSKR